MYSYKSRDLGYQRHDSRGMISGQATTLNDPQILSQPYVMAKGKRRTSPVPIPVGAQQLGSLAKGRKNQGGPGSIKGGKNTNSSFTKGLRSGSGSSQRPSSDC